MAFLRKATGNMADLDKTLTDLRMEFYMGVTDGSIELGGPTTTPTPLAPNPSNGSGGLFTDRTAVAYANTGFSSTYHIYASKISRTAPVGLIIHLHGDGAEEVLSPAVGMLPDYLLTAQKHGMLLVAPLTPDDVNLTWYSETYPSFWLNTLLIDLKTKYNIDQNNIWFIGYSGGAEVLTYYTLRTYHSQFTGGGAIMLGGGGAAGLTADPNWSEELKSNFKLHWVVGSRDSVAQGGTDGGFDAVKASLAGKAYFEEFGAKADISFIPGASHIQSEVYGPKYLSDLLNAREN